MRGARYVRLISWTLRSGSEQHYQHDGLVMVGTKPASDEATMINHAGVTDVRSEKTLTGESQFHISTPLVIELVSLMMGSKRVDHWTSGAVCECSEIAGSPQSSAEQSGTSKKYFSTVYSESTGLVAKKEPRQC